ncbi:COMM domain-containing protein 10 isoform X1 [Macrobrachium rosenbergii]|uniref:COMM domain-containing protein 10 isoform X1 n=2 Tax=Macrobrachium rosenbergii TaxID=79674 RepID=UPI0034D7780F
MLQLTKRLQEGISLMNNTDSGKINGLLTRICSALISNRSQVFTEEEEEKLSASLVITRDQTQLLIKTIIHIIQQAAHGMVRPALLKEHLLAAGISQDKTDIFIEQWSANAKAIVDTLRQQCLSEKQLEDVAWDLHLKSASSTLARQAQPIAHVQLTLGDGTSKGSSTTSEKVLMQFSHDQLYDFYDQLEQIQSHLDSLR